jgi:flagellar biogenesis protein FliO
MPRPTLRRRAAAGLWLGLVLGLCTAGVSGRRARAEHPPPTAAIGGMTEAGRPLLPQRASTAPRPGASPGGSGGWWLGTAGIALALAAFGAVSLGFRRYLPRPGSGPLRVVGRTSLSPKHSVYLLEAGDRVLLVGTGPQGAPSLLGELTDPAELERLRPRRASATAAGFGGQGAPTAHFDRRVGDDE